MWMLLTQNALFRYFLARVLEKLLSYLKSAASSGSICKISPKKKKKSLNSGPDMPDLGILGVKFENNIVIFEMSTIEFV